MLENHVGVRKLAAQTAFPLFQRVFASHLESGNTVKGAELKGKARGEVELWLPFID